MSIKLTDFRNTHDIILTAYPDAKVVVYDSVLFKDGQIISNFNKNVEDPKNIAAMLSLIIKEWPFVDEADKPLPVNENSLSLIKPEALKELVEKITAIISEKKNG